MQSSSGQSEPYQRSYRYRDSAVDSITQIPVVGTAGNEPVRTSFALPGDCAQILPYSEISKRCMVPPRNDVATEILEPLCANSISVPLFVFSGKRSNICAVSCQANLILSLKISPTVSRF